MLSAELSVHAFDLTAVFLICSSQDQAILSNLAMLSWSQAQSVLFLSAQL